eukprot:TRINITY_DN615_c0_g2_i6.p1 TRINITY_DN615_c0_g2~~TRINITY_DN615_c0_g2_i6.p1  ORF type:complete len:1190 (-),score=496.85 TRINITY_DN615_c0_g2_i6:17-3586(-)
MGKKTKKGPVGGDYEDPYADDVKPDDEAEETEPAVPSNPKQKSATTTTTKAEPASKSKSTVQKEDSDEDEKPQQPAKKGGKKGGKKKDDYWESTYLEDEESQKKPKSDDEKDEELPAITGKKKKKTTSDSKAKSTPQPASDDDDSEEEKSKKKKKVTTTTASTKSAKGKSASQPVSDEDDSEEEKPQPSKKKAGAAPSKTTETSKSKPTQQPAEDNDSEDEKQITGKKKKKKAAATTPSPATTTTTTTSDVPAPPAASDQAPALPGGKKKKKAALAAAAAAAAAAPTAAVPEQPAEPAKKEGAKQTAADKKRMQMIALLKQQREEQERQAKEAEERRLKEAEEARIRQEEEDRLEEERRRKAQIKRAKQKEKELVAVQVAKNQKNVAYLESLRAQGIIPQAANDSGEKKKVVYDTKKKKKSVKKDDDEDEATPSSSSTTTPSAPDDASDATKEAQPSSSSPAAAPAAADDWEDWDDKDLVLPGSNTATTTTTSSSVEPITSSLKNLSISSNNNSNEKTKVNGSANANKEDGTATKSAKDASTNAATKTTNKQQKQVKQAQKVKPSSQTKKKGESSSSDDDSESGSDAEDGDATKNETKELRSPICCILGHVDTGKTSLLDKIRSTNVQEGEAGGITQQIGASYFPISVIEEKTKGLSEKLEIKIPGLLVIDTPGHESFTNLRSRGSGLCDIAILVVDIMHLLEPQTIESIKLLRMRKTPFVVALNKVDRVYGWRPTPNNPFRESLKNQDKSSVQEFETRTQEVINAFAEQGLNAVLYYRNRDFRKYVSLVPTSAVTGEGIPDLLMLLAQLTQRMMPERLYFQDEVQCTVLEVKQMEGQGTTLDVILVNGMLREGDTIVLGGMNGPIVTQIRSLITPQPLRELRVKSANYIYHKEIKAAMGVKVIAADLEKAVAGSALTVANTDDEIEDAKKEVQSDFDSILTSIDNSAKGVCVQASTLGSLEALLTFLKASKIPVSGVSIGPIHKRDLIRASVMLEHNPEYAVILAFDVKIDKEIEKLAEDMKIKIFQADIIYHLFDQFTKYMEDIREKRRSEIGSQAIWPVIMRIKPDCIYRAKDPIVVGVTILEGTLKMGTPISIPSNNYLDLGVVIGIEKNHKQQQEAKKGEEVAVKIESTAEHARSFGRHFDTSGDLCSKISRESIDVLKELWGDKLTNPDKQLIVKLKTIFKIQ